VKAFSIFEFRFLIFDHRNLCSKGRLGRRAWTRGGWAALVPALLLAGCGPAPNAGKKAENKPATPEIVQTVESTSGSVQVLGPKREKLWYIEWKNASVRVNEKGISFGSMEEVRGALFAEGGKDSTFSADSALGDKLDQKDSDKDKRNVRLTLEGNVHLRSKDPDAEITCDRLVYDGEKKLIDAQGHVRVQGKVGTIGTLSQVLATFPLKRIATPGMFYDQ
jgi:hypothetical protein